MSESENYEFKELNEQLKTFIKQMNAYMGFLSSEKKLRELNQAHKKAKIIASGKNPGDENLSNEEKITSGQEETNAYLKKLVELSTLEEKRSKKKLEFDFSKQSLKGFLDPSSIAGSLSSLGKEINRPGKSVTGYALQTPGAIMNLFKNMSRTRNAKDIEGRRKEIDSLKVALDTKLEKLLALQKNPRKNKEKILDLKENVEKLTKTLDLKTTQLGDKLSTAIAKSEKNLGVSPSFNKKEMAEYNVDRANNIKSSFFDDVQTKVDQLLAPKRRTKTTKTQEASPQGVVSRVGNALNPLRPIASGVRGLLSGNGIGATATLVSSAFNYKIPIVTTQPSTFAETIGGIYYKLTSINDILGKQNPINKKEDTSGSGFWGSLIGMLGIPLLIAGIKKIPSLLTSMAGRILKSMGSSISKGFSGLTKSIAGFFSKYFPKTSEMLSKLAGGLKKFLPKKLPISGATAIKGAGVLGKVGKTALKRLPLIGALLTAGTVAAETRGPVGRKASAGTGAAAISGLGVAGGAALGATIGSVVPFIGTAVGGVIGAILGGIGGEKLGKVIGTGVYDAMQKKESPVMRENGKINPILQNQSELERTKDMTMDPKMYELAMYNALKKHTAEDMDQNEGKRARARAAAMIEEANK